VLLHGRRDIPLSGRHHYGHASNEHQSYRQPDSRRRLTKDASSDQHPSQTKASGGKQP
jgi:hypothetical protein